MKHKVTVIIRLHATTAAAATYTCEENVYSGS